jgi:hypothetical protein
MGDQNAIDQEDWRVFNATGIGHLISIKNPLDSDLHVQPNQAVRAYKFSVNLSSLSDSEHLDLNVS